MINSKLRGILYATAAAAVLSGCGADDIAQPDIVITPPAPSPAPAPTPTPTPTPTPAPPSGKITAAAASACTTGTVDNGIITLAGDAGTVRNCRINSSVITQNITLSGRRDSGLVYTLPGRTEIGLDRGFNGTANSEVVMTINPGVTVVATDLSSFLVANRGSRLEAVGNSDDPIIFTHIDQLTGNVTDTTNRLWGGLQLLGRAPVADCGSGTSLAAGNCERSVEGPVGQPIFYGGNDPTWDAGTIRFVQILFTGVGSGGNELQGLTTGGVGSNTQIDYVQVHNSADDGIESFGGRQDMSHLIFTGVADDSVDLDTGYQGAIQFVLAIRRQGTNTGEAGDSTIFEIDSSTSDPAAANQAPRTDVVIANFTLISPETDSPVIKLRGGADIALINGVVVGQSAAASNSGCLDVDNSFTVQASGSTQTGNNTPSANDKGPPVFQSVVFDCPTLYDPDSDDFEAQAFTAAGNANNNGDFTNSLQSVFINGANENGVTATGNLSQAYDAFLQSPGYIGAVKDANDTWYKGWTCNTDVASFGSAQDCKTYRVS